MAFYAATDLWPEHPKPWFREVYRIARGHGWTLETHSSHTGSATARCPSGECSFKVFATGRGGESVAKTHKRMIERCAHAVGAGDSLVRATELLDKAERLLNALDALQERERANNRAQALLFDADGFDEREIDDLWLTADRLAVEAEELLSDVSAAGEDQIVDTADSALSEARALLGPLPGTNEVASQKVRASSLRARCDAYRTLSSHS